MELSPHFTLEELTHTDTGFPNDPSPDQIKRLTYLANYALERVRYLLGTAIKINSGFRSPAVNDAVHGSKTSAHLRGDAADIVPSMDLLTAYKLTMDDLGLGYDQLIWEAHTTPRGGMTRWIHIGLADQNSIARRQKLIYTPKTNGKYLPFDEGYIV